jgi:3',5'-cyclic-AMP phosphodiesterase
MVGGRFILAQISDTHVRVDDDGAAVAKLRQALAAAGAYKADAIVLTGDLANDGDAEEYQALARALDEAPAPFFLLPGNHDDRELLLATFPGADYFPCQPPFSYAVEDFPVRLVCLDQVAPGDTGGDFTPEAARWLDQTLAQAPEKPTLLALHHPPFASHDLLFDRIGMKHAEAFAAVIARHCQVARIVCGHHHRAVFGQVAHAPCVIAPSTSWTYGLALHQDQRLAPVSSEAPGWMLHVWTPSGGFASHVMGLR